MAQPGAPRLLPLFVLAGLPALLLFAGILWDERERARADANRLGHEHATGLRDRVDDVIEETWTLLDLLLEVDDPCAVLPATISRRYRNVGVGLSARNPDGPDALCQTLDGPPVDSALRIELHRGEGEVAWAELEPAWLNQALDRARAEAGGVLLVTDLDRQVLAANALGRPWVGRPLPDIHADPPPSPDGAAHVYEVLPVGAASRLLLVVGRPAAADDRLVTRAVGRLAIGMVAIAVCTAAASAVALDRFVLRHWRDERALRARLVALSRRVVQEQESARLEMAHALHDELGQLATGVALTLDAATRGPVEARAGVLAEARALVMELTEALRRLSRQLRPPLLEEEGLAEALAWQVAEFTRQTHVEVDLRVGDLGPRMPAETENAALRTVQGALLNVARHAATDRAVVVVERTPDALVVVVVDYGTGFDPTVPAAEGSTGLARIRDRASLLGGGFVVESRPGEGTTVRAEFPLEPSP